MYRKLEYHSSSMKCHILAVFPRTDGIHFVLCDFLSANHISCAGEAIFCSCPLQGLPRNRSKQRDRRYCRDHSLIVFICEVFAEPDYGRRQRSYSGTSSVSLDSGDPLPKPLCRRHSSSHTSLCSRPPSVNRKLSYCYSHYNSTDD